MDKFQLETIIQIRLKQPTTKGTIVKRLMILALILMLCVGFAGAVSAQDEGAAESPAENACYTGGDLEGKCDWPTDEEDAWAWNCGWYYARVVEGSIGVEQAPDWCAILFSKAEAPGEEPGFSLCLSLEAGYLLLEGEPNQPGNATFHLLETRAAASNPCDEIKPSANAVIWMQTPAYIAYDVALELCNATDTAVTWTTAAQISDPALPNFNFYCYN